jgi:hypothetical protein
LGGPGEEKWGMLKIWFLTFLGVHFTSNQNNLTTRRRLNSLADSIELALMENSGFIVGFVI